MLITRKHLMRFGACEEGIIQAENNGLLPCDSDKINIADLVINSNVNFVSLAWAVFPKISDVYNLVWDYFNKEDYKNDVYVVLEKHTAIKGVEDLKDSFFDKIILPTTIEDVELYHRMQIAFGERCLAIMLSFSKEEDEE